MSRPLVIFLPALLLSVLTLLYLWVTEIPLGVAGEWVWGRIPYEAGDSWDLVSGGLLALLVAGAFLGLVHVGAKRIETASPLASAAWLAGLVAAGFSWLFVVQLCPPEGYGIEKSAWVLYYPMASGYFYEARYREEPVDEYLANYEEDIQTGDRSRRILHHGTHPPGLFLCYRGLIRLCESSPSLVQAVLKTQPSTVAAVFDDMQSRASFATDKLRESDRAVIWLAALLTQLCGAGVVVPLFFLAESTASRRAAWIAAAFWPLIPALAVFLPKSDVLYAFLGLAFLAVWWSGWRRNSWWRCLLAGGVFWLGMLLSLAMLPVAFLAAVMSLLEAFLTRNSPDESRSIKQSLILIGTGAAGFLLPTLLLWATLELNLFVVWWQNYKNHAEFYQHFERTYATWLWVNPLETLLSVGAPVAVLAIAGLWQVWKDRKSLPVSAWAPVVAIVTTLAILWLSGKNRGEAARLWLAIFPLIVWLSARAWDLMKQNRFLWAMLGLQILVCGITVCRVNGFPL